MFISGLWIVSDDASVVGDGSKVEIIVSKYANDSEFVFDPRIEQNDKNPMICLPRKSDEVSDAFMIWMKEEGSLPDAYSYDTTNKRPSFGVSLIDSFEIQIQGRAVSYRERVRFALVLMCTKLNIDPLQHISKECLELIRTGVMMNGHLTGLHLFCVLFQSLHRADV
jgi:hypothetical protein